jgi:3D (Asp-Asp-Asp) domain-containing protein
MKRAAVCIFVLLWALIACSNAPDLITNWLLPDPPEEQQLVEEMISIEPQLVAISREAERINYEAEPTAEPESEIWTVTAYCACEKCCPGSADGLTASNRRPVEGVTVAADPSVPFGTEILIEGLGTRIVEDRGSAITGNHIDVYFADHETAKQFGVQYLKVSIKEEQS